MKHDGGRARMLAAWLGGLAAAVAFGAGAAEERAPDPGFLEFLGTWPEEEASDEWLDFLGSFPVDEREAPGDDDADDTASDDEDR